VIPKTERNQDPEDVTHELATETSRPLTSEERQAAEGDAPAREPVYAPASERVPRTVAGYRDVTEHTDTATPERQALGQTSEGTHMGTETEPSFTRVSRPGTGPISGNGSEEPEATGWSPRPGRWMSNASTVSMLPMGMGWVTLSIFGGLGVWLWMRWRRERNKPINRLRRQARQTAAQARQRAAELRSRVPEIPELPDEAARPAVGLGTVLLSIAVLLWQQSQSRSRSQLETRGREMGRKADKASKHASKLGRQAAQTVADVDWQTRLLQLKHRWSPGRLEMEKVTISRR